MNGRTKAIFLIKICACVVSSPDGCVTNGLIRVRGPETMNPLTLEPQKWPPHLRKIHLLCFQSWSLERRQLACSLPPFPFTGVAPFFFGCFYLSIFCPLSRPPSHPLPAQQAMNSSRSGRGGETLDLKCRSCGKRKRAKECSSFRQELLPLFVVVPDSGEHTTPPVFAHWLSRIC